MALRAQTAAAILGGLAAIVVATTNPHFEVQDFTGGNGVPVVSVNRKWEYEGGYPDSGKWYAISSIAAAVTAVGLAYRAMTGKL